MIDGVLFGARYGVRAFREVEGLLWLLANRVLLRHS
jgi:hypothetical protein